ncbi:MAG: DUF6290 family protein [Eubacteriaceae bacterium]
MSKDQFITIRVSSEEKKLLRQLAKENDMTISKYILHTAKETAVAMNFIKENSADNTQLSFFDKNKTKFCRVCGSELTIDSGYCARCGTRIE